VDRINLSVRMSQTSQRRLDTMKKTLVVIKFIDNRATIPEHIRRAIRHSREAPRSLAVLR